MPYSFFGTIFNPNFAKKDSNTAFVTYHHHYPYGIYNEKKNTHDAAQCSSMQQNHSIYEASKLLALICDDYLHH